MVDRAGRGVADPSGALIGMSIQSRDRMAWALSLNAPQSVSVRYQPNHPPTESCNFWMDFSFLIPFGVGITAGSLAIFQHLAFPVASTDWSQGPVIVQGRAIYATLSGGALGKDYELRWTATDTAGNLWPRTALVLCAETS